MNRSSIIKNKSISKFNFNDVMNFNFGLQNPAQLKLINTTMLTTNSPQKNSKNNIISIKHSEKKNQLYNESTNLKQNQTKYLVGYSLSRKNEKKKNVEKKISFLSQDKYIKNKNGILILPSLSSTHENKKIIPKINYKSLNKEKDKDMILIKNYQRKKFR